MAVKYQKFKSKSFPLRKDAAKWAKDMKKNNPGMGIKIDINYHADGPMPWEAVILMKV